MNSYNFLKKIAFLFDPELIHNFTIKTFSHFPSSAKMFALHSDEKYHISDGHMLWKFPIGLAAGLDKNAEALNFFNTLGFGSIEAGTVTPLKQEGNPKPRIWRYSEEESLRNAMGFPNCGAEKFMENIMNSNRVFCLGINVGKNKESKDDLADYVNLIDKFKNNCQYLAINISSPNTKDLRDLQSSSFLETLNDEIKTLNCTRPIYVKLSPDMSKESIQSLTEKCIDLNFSGIICTNTTANHKFSSGGISGKQLKSLSKTKRAEVCEVTSGAKNFSTIGVGGVDSAKDLFEFWSIGGDMMQIYTAFIYHGPKILNDFKEDIDIALKKHQLANVEELKEFFKTKNQIF